MTQSQQSAKKTFFSIIIPTRNERKRLDYCLPSLLNQSFQDFEIIIVEDPETNDGTKEFIDSLNSDKITYFLHDKGLKLPAKRNVGAEKAQGKYIYFMDADMEVPENTLQKIYDVLSDQSFPEIVFIPEQTPGKAWVNRMKNYEKYLTDGNIHLSAARMYLREFFNTLGGYNPNLIAAEDGFFSDKAIAQGGRYLFAPVRVNHYEVSDSGIGHFKKKIKFGISASNYFQAESNKELSEKHKELAKKRKVNGRLVYVAHESHIKNPIMAVQFMVFKSIEITALLYGYLYGKLTGSQVINYK